MHSKSNIDFSQSNKLSIWSLLFGIKNFMKAIWPVLLVFGASTLFNTKEEENPEKNVYLLWLFIGTISFLIMAKAQDIAIYFHYSYSVKNGFIIAKMGVWKRKQIEIPIKHIQSVSIGQDLLHRLTNTCKVHIDSGGSSSQEIALVAVELPIAIALQEILQPQAHDPHIEAQEIEHLTAAEPETTYQLSMSDLLKLCWSENHVQTLMLICVFGFSRLKEVEEYLHYDSFAYVKESSKSFSSTWQTIALAVFIIIFISLLVSCIRVAIRYYNFNIAIKNGTYSFYWGLLNTKRRQVPIAKVQWISWQATWLRRKMNMYILRMHALSEDEQKPKQQIKIPATNTQLLHSLVEPYCNQLPNLSNAYTGISKKYIIRKFLLIGIPVYIAATIGAYNLVGWHCLWLIIWPIYYYLFLQKYQQNFQAWISENALQTQSGVWGRKFNIAKIERIVSVSIHSSPWQYRYGLRTLKIYVAGDEIKIPYLLEKDAYDLCNFLLARTTFTQYNWHQNEIIDPSEIDHINYNDPKPLGS